MCSSSYRFGHYITCTGIKSQFESWAAHINCAGGNNAEITADATGGLGNYQYELLDSDTAPITVLQRSKHNR